jgi:Rrf2 family nitric oxide-sensitive transcriptional repressor
MQLTRHTDYALRLLIHLALTEAAGGGRIAIAEVARAQDISRTHLMKIANELVHAGFVRAARGRAGGLQLGRPASEINLAAVIEVTERHCRLVDCQDCRLTRRCALPGIFEEATQAFTAVLGKYSLADFIAREVQPAISPPLAPARGGGSLPG